MDFHYTVATTKSVDEVIGELTESLKKQKFGVLWQLDIAAKLEEKGVEFNMPYRVLEVCNPHEAKEVLTQNHLVGYFLPCKIVVYQTEDGVTHIGLPRPTVMMEIVHDATLAPIAERVEQSLIHAIHEIL